MNFDQLPLALLPENLSDEAAAQLIEILQELARVLENDYAAQIRRYYHPPERDERQLDFWDDTVF